MADAADPLEPLDAEIEVTDYTPDAPMPDADAAFHTVGLLSGTKPELEKFAKPVPPMMTPVHGGGKLMVGNPYATGRAIESARARALKAAEDRLDVLLEIFDGPSDDRLKLDIIKTLYGIALPTKTEVEHGLMQKPVIFREVDESADNHTA